MKTAYTISAYANIIPVVGTYIYDSLDGRRNFHAWDLIPIQRSVGERDLIPTTDRHLHSRCHPYTTEKRSIRTAVNQQDVTIVQEDYLSVVRTYIRALQSYV